MHLPKYRCVERSWIFYRLNGHHLLHHRYMHKNFNVVMPFADFVFRHIAAPLENQISAQPRGAAIPRRATARQIEIRLRESYYHSG